MSRNYTLDLNVNFSKPLRIEVKVILENHAKEAELAKRLDTSANELKKAVDDNQPQDS